LFCNHFEGLYFLVPLRKGEVWLWHGGRLLCWCRAI